MVLLLTGAGQRDTEQMADSRSSHRTGGKAATVGIHRDRKTRAGDLADVLGYQEASRRDHESFEGSWHFRRSHEVETEKLYLSLSSRPYFYLRLVSSGKYNDLYPEKKKPIINQTSDGYIRTYTYTHGFCMCVYVQTFVYHASFIYNFNKHVYFLLP